MSTQSNEKTQSRQDFRDLAPGFCPEIPDLSVRVWRDGRLTVVTSGHYGETAIHNAEGAVLIIFRRLLPRFGLALSKLTYSAFTGTAFTRITSVRFRDNDCVNCNLHNLEVVCAEETVTGEESDAMHRAALEDGLRLGGETELDDDDDYLMVRHARQGN